MGITEKIEAIQLEMSRTQEYHLGLLKAKLAKYRAELLEPAKKSGKPGEGFDVSKAGYGRVALIGFPSVGKSTLLSKLTGTESSVAAYEYTTLTAIPGVLEIDGAKLQLLDLPGIIEGASEGRGRGRQVVAVAKTADLVIIMLDVTKGDSQRRLLEIELEAVGIRLNKKKPDITFKRKTAGGVTVTTTVPMTKTDEKSIRGVLQAYKIHSADVMIREDVTIDDFVDVLIGTRKYVNCLYVYNKIDSISLEEVDRLAREPNTVVISCELDLNLDILLKRIWAGVGLNRVYTKKRGEKPDLGDPLIVKDDATILDVCHAIHRSLHNHFGYAFVWGKSSKFAPQPQKVGLTHRVSPTTATKWLQSEGAARYVAERIEIDGRYGQVDAWAAESVIAQARPGLKRLQVDFVRGLSQRAFTVPNLAELTHLTLHTKILCDPVPSVVPFQLTRLVLGGSYFPLAFIKALFTASAESLTDLAMTLQANHSLDLRSTINQAVGTLNQLTTLSDWCRSSQEFIDLVPYLPTTLKTINTCFPDRHRLLSLEKAFDVNRLPRLESFRFMYLSKDDVRSSADGARFRAALETRGVMVTCGFEKGYMREEHLISRTEALKPYY
ncbi:developmentally regulated GTP-binding protein 2 [Pseudohyphozyma bogoriensis]|nr:developmentally regulated GTP-binding protein 2 [Pseudohyphozyma bogoriensis]